MSRSRDEEITHIPIAVPVITNKIEKVTSLVAVRWNGLIRRLRGGEEFTLHLD